MQRTIVCYGDSNTWGYIPATAANKVIERYPRDVRWPGVLQILLGKNYYVVEEGLNSRTTNLDYHVAPNRNGKTYLPSCLYSHAPIDLVILALGGNDFKTYFNRKAEDIRDGMAEIIDIIQASAYGAKMQAPPQVLIIPPSIPLPVAEQYKDENGVAIFQSAIEKAKLLIQLYANLAKERNCYFIDISKNIFPSPVDGLHINEVAHKELAQIVHDKIISIL